MATLAVSGLLESVNPATLELVGAVERTAPDEIATRVAGAQVVQAQWARTSLRERAQLLARALESVLRPERLPLRQLHLRHKRARLVYDPYGVVAVVSPWNYPVAIPLTQAAAAIAAGNAVVVKPSELTPLCGEWTARVFELAGAPAGLVTVVQGEADLGVALVSATGIAKVFFTGSTDAGRSVALAAAGRLCPVSLELGGKDAMLVFADADLDRAVAGALWGAFANCGQTCSSVERIYVERRAHDEFVQRLAAAARGLRIPDELGPLVSERQRLRVEELVETARERVVAGGRRPEVGLPGWFYEPTVIAGSSDRLAGEEIFGPVVTVEPFDDEDGRTHARHGLYECARVRYVDSDRGRLRVPWWFPYDDGLLDGFRAFVDVTYGDGVRAAWRHRAGLRRLARRLR